MSKEPLEYLKHIRDEITFILSVISDDLSKDDFLSDETLKRAVVRSLEIIGEAPRRFPLILNINGIPFNGKIWQGCVID
jgi:uncharacterized protein with HEPN domain